MTTEQAIEMIRKHQQAAVALRLAGRVAWAFQNEKMAVKLAAQHGLRVADVI